MQPRLLLRDFDGWRPFCETKKAKIKVTNRRPKRLNRQTFALDVELDRDMTP